MNAADIDDSVIIHVIIDSGVMHELSDDGRDPYAQQLGAVQKRRSVSSSGSRPILLAGSQRHVRGRSRRSFSSGWRRLKSGADPAASRDPNAALYFYDFR
jgi:hypothetical protein